jgi:PDZ domain-containing protein
MTRRTTTFAVALALLLGLLIVGSQISVPYVILLPGPVTDTLGNVPAGDTANGRPGGPVIQISGVKTQPTNGHLYLTTVEELPGDCDQHPSLWHAIKAWFSKTETVEPQQVECPPGETAQADQQKSVQEMSESQVHAITAALTELGYTSTGNRIAVASVESGTPAAKVLHAGDVIEAVNGHQIHSVTQLRAAVSAKPAPAPLQLTIQRSGGTQTVSTTSIKGKNGMPMIGIGAVLAPTFNGIEVNIGIDPDVIGGPSAGTALALGIIDKLTPGGLTGGRTIAGTGTVSATGKVGPIGGIQQKIAAAVRAHATVFFAPASECPDAKAAAPSSLTLVKITTLHEAVTSLQAIKAGSTAFPHC